MKFKAKALVGAATLALVSAAPALAQDVSACLITKTDTNPFFVKMKEGATAEAKKLGAKLVSAAGKTDGDNAGQVTAMENLIAAGAKTILITPSDAKAIVPAIKKAQARARTYADALGLQVRRIVSISEGGAAMPSPMPRMATMKAQAYDSTPVAAGESSVSLNLDVVFELGQ